MAADHPTARGTLPSPLLPFKKPIYAMLPDNFEVLDHAHPEMASVALVEVNQAFTGEIPAFIAVRHPAIQEQVAPLLEEGTLLISRPTAGAVRHSYTLALHIACESKVPAAYAAVHPAGSDQRLIHFTSLHC